ncbi:phosphoribosyltransferase family protein [Gracilimonas sp.]|uniref:phosphoribosyltransferase family protein n=1 Tax=Gracilimonas sp. TaxID=1974203 RepID=UPI0028726E79|nr:phosphoribosyltransferase family protein [Gracilimonas sp.]
MEKQLTLMDQPRIKRTLKRIAIQVWEKIEDVDDLIIIGLNERGFAAANELANHLSTYTENASPVYQYTVYGTSTDTKLPDCNDKFVLLVDDVIFSGKTMFSALSAVCSIYDPKAVEIGVLIDRGHRKFPLSTNMSGITVPTETGEHIEVMLKNGQLEEAILFKNK